MFVVVGNKRDENTQFLTNEILPQVRKLEAYVKNLISIREVLGFSGDGFTIIPLVQDPDAEVVGVAIDGFDQGSVHEGLVAPPDGGLVDERQVYDIKLVLNGPGVVDGPNFTISLVGEFRIDVLEKGQGRVGLPGFAPPEPDEPMSLTRDICLDTESRWNVPLFSLGGDSRALA